jgi:four helix bundle protein
MMNDEYENNLKMTNRQDPLREKSFGMALRLVRLYRFLAEEKKEYVMSKQILRSGTNPGAMVREAANAESGLDCIHKLGIAQKETGETQYWLDLLFKSDYINEAEHTSLYADTEQVMRLLRSSILTKKKNLATKASAFIILIATTSYLLM